MKMKISKSYGFELNHLNTSFMIHFLKTTPQSLRIQLSELIHQLRISWMSIKYDIFDLHNTR